MDTSFMCARHQIGSYYHTLRQILWRAVVYVRRSRLFSFQQQPFLTWSVVNHDCSLTVKVSNSVTVQSMDTVPYRPTLG
nr:MAG TPA: hypothetical protein [Caudoviricetes sp.]